MKRTNVGALCATGLLASFLVTISLNASATTVFLDNFEDGNTSGWLESATGSGGSTGVESHNGSQMAFVRQAGSSSLRSLSYDFNYLASETLSFDMHAVAVSTVSGTRTLQASSGVTVSFLNIFNVSLGSASLVNATNPASLASNASLIDGAQHNYTALLSDYVALAGLGAADPISKISLTYFATSEYSFGGNVVPNQTSTATVWFDNVSVGDVSAVPIPAAVWLFGSGLLGLIGIARRKKA